MESVDLFNFNKRFIEEAIKKLSSCYRQEKFVDYVNKLKNINLLSEGESAKQIKELNEFTIQLLNNMDLLLSNTIKYLIHLSDTISESDKELAELITNSIENPYNGSDVRLGASGIIIGVSSQYNIK